MSYTIMGQPKQKRGSLERRPAAEIDTAEDLAEAKKLVHKYRIVFGAGWRIWKVWK